MGRALLVLSTDADRAKAVHWIGKAPVGTRVEFKASKRTLPQNDRMWAMLTDIAAHEKKERGLDYSTDEWKLIFLHAWGREVRFLPALDGRSVVPVPQSSSDLSKDEMTDFIEFLFSEGSKRGITFHEPSGVPVLASDDRSGGEVRGAAAPTHTASMADSGPGVGASSTPSLGPANSYAKMKGM